MRLPLCKIPDQAPHEGGIAFAGEQGRATLSLPRRFFELEKRLEGLVNAGGIPVVDDLGRSEGGKPVPVLPQLLAGRARSASRGFAGDVRPGISDRTRGSVPRLLSAMSMAAYTGPSRSSDGRLRTLGSVLFSIAEKNARDDGIGIGRIDNRARYKSVVERQPVEA
jgi:hypothetical protein